jgi:hypothetical protein
VSICATHPASTLQPVTHGFHPNGGKMRTPQLKKLPMLVAAAGLCAASATSALAATVCEMTISVTAEEDLAVAEIAVDYSAVQGTFVGASEAVECSPLLSDTSIIKRDTCGLSDNYCYAGENRGLNVILSRQQGMEGGVPLVSCSFIAPESQTPSVESFRVQTRTATSLATGDDTPETPVATIDELTCSQQ